MFQDGKCRVMRNEELLCTTSIDNGPYVLRNAVVEASAHVSQASTESEELWHHRFGYVPLRTLKKMARDGMVSGFSSTKKPQNDVHCVPCTEGKQSRLSLSARTSKQTAPGQVVFICLWPNPSSEH